MAVDALSRNKSERGAGVEAALVVSLGGAAAGDAGGGEGDLQKGGAEGVGVFVSGKVSAVLPLSQRAIFSQPRFPKAAMGVLNSRYSVSCPSCVRRSPLIRSTGRRDSKPSGSMARMRSCSTR